MTLNAPDPSAQHPLLVTTHWLAEHLDDPGLVLLDAGEPVAFRRAHIRGATGLPEPRLKGREDDVFVMPPAEFEAVARRVGVSSESEVVIYDDFGSLNAARAWWVLQHYGHQHVRVLDGGLTAWLAEERPVTAARSTPAEGDFTARREGEDLRTLDELREVVGTEVQIWDTRSDGEWRGSNDRGNRRMGHIPGAKHLEWSELVEPPPSSRFRPLPEIRLRLQAAGIAPEAETITYCQAGIRAAVAVLVLRMVGGERARLYDGSMREWANRDDTPLVADDEL